MLLTDFVLSNNLVEEAKRVNRRRNVCSGQKKFGAQSSTTTKGNNSSAAADAEATRRPISIKDEEREESGVRGSDKGKEGTARGGMTSLKPKLEDT